MPQVSTPYHSGHIRQRAGRLLDMLYTVSEIAEELDVSPASFRYVFVRAGCPHTRDTRGHIWIHGKSFAHWLQTQYPKALREPYAVDEIYCMHCHKRTKFDPIDGARADRWTRFTTATPVTCRECGRTMRKMRGRNHDSP